MKSKLVRDFFSQSITIENQLNKGIYPGEKLIKRFVVSFTVEDLSVREYEIWCKTRSQLNTQVILLD